MKFIGDAQNQEYINVLSIYSNIFSFVALATTSRGNQILKELENNAVCQRKSVTVVCFGVHID